MSPCSRCGRPRENRHRYCRECQSAYSDYDRPLDVEWRCRVHHLEIPRDRILT